MGAGHTSESECGLVRSTSGWSPQVIILLVSYVQSTKKFRGVLLLYRVWGTMAMTGIMHDTILGPSRGLCP